MAQRNKTVSIQRKIEVVDQLRTNNGNVHKTFRDTGFSRKSIRRWRDSEDALRNVGSSRKKKRLAGGGRKVRSDLLEKEMMHWVKEQRGAKLCVTYRSLQESARRLASSLHLDDFKGGDNWVSSFMSRNKLSRYCNSPSSEVLPSFFVFFYTAKNLLLYYPRHILRNHTHHLFAVQ